ncbi:MAG: SPOR domain-containing protein [Bacteroidia bacterium]
MVKYLFILINSLSLFLYSLFGGDGGITVTNTIPTSIKPGQTIKAEVKINKGNMGGFAKMQLDLPPGVTVNEIDNKGANFSFLDGFAKWVWASLPTESEIVIKFSITAEASAPLGKTVIGGKYSYVENNAKQVIEMAPVDLTIGEEGAVATNSQGQETKTTTTTTPVTNANEGNANVTTTVTPENNAGNQTNVSNEPAGNITVQRTITKGPGEGEYTINLKVNKGATKGFARYSDDLPSTLGARAGKTDGASFSVADGKVKFVWVAGPEKDNLELSYTLIGVTMPTVLNGEYSYLEENQSKKYNLQPETITPEAATNAVNTNTQATESNTAGVQVTINNETSTTVTTTSGITNVTNNENKTQPNETSTKKEGNVNYHVQIGAFTNSNVSADRLKRKFNISEKIQSEFHGGFSKFMIGSHGEYKEARDHREQVRNNNGVRSAFVVAYNTGKRITVQEALMISNQKWFK